jgi:hypothetical protein
MGRKPTLQRTISTPMARKVMKEADQKSTQASEETNQRLPTPTTEEEEKEIQAACVPQPTLVDRQQAALNARAQSRFGVDATFANTFSALKKGMVVPIVLRYTARWVSTGCLQEVVELTLAKLTADMYGHLIEAEFERPTHLSYRIDSAARTDTMRSPRTDPCGTSTPAGRSGPTTSRDGSLPNCRLWRP